MDNTHRNTGVCLKYVCFKMAFTLVRLLVPPKRGGRIVFQPQKLCTLDKFPFDMCLSATPSRSIMFLHRDLSAPSEAGGG